MPVQRSSYLLTDDERAVLSAAWKYREQFNRASNRGMPLTDVERLWSLQNELLLAAIK